MSKTIAYLRERYQLSSLGQKIIYKLFNIIKKCISQLFLWGISIRKFVENNSLRNIAVEESLFVQEHDGTQEWVIGLIDIHTKNIRLELVHEGNNEIMKKIIQHHIGYTNTIINDDWEVYNWLREYGYHHIVHIHGSQDFLHGTESTSHIELIWGN